MANRGGGRIRPVLIQVSAKKITFPRVCPCCAQPADADLPISASRTTGKRVVRTKTNTWTIPYCESCINHVRVWNSRWNTFWPLFILGVILGGMVYSNSDSRLTGILPFAVSMGVGIWAASRTGAKARHLCSSSCSAPSRVISYLGWDGTVESFDILGRAYALRFMAANAPKLINVTAEHHRLISAAIDEERASASRLIEENRGGLMLASSPPPIILPERMEAEDLHKWVAKLECLKGPAARRTALESGLQALKTQDARDRLMLEASKIEVQAALDKADGLKTTAAKRRTLQAALDAIQADSIPDELQAQQIRWLEEALAEIEQKC